ncbi:Fe2OG dioxygenase domain-containing protein [Psidium guajava]|nr:Fe2OG dioxygenase domain-containing protein [Psidium guajava]
MAAISSEAASLSEYPPLPIDLRFDLDEALTDLASCSGLRCRMDALESSLSAMPTAAFVTGACPICMEAFHSDNKRASCGHVYHEPCIATWLSLCSYCPLCRCDIVTASQP